jgi:hypothetical protein
MRPPPPSVFSVKAGGRHFLLGYEKCGKPEIGATLTAKSRIRSWFELLAISSTGNQNKRCLLILR